MHAPSRDFIETPHKRIFSWCPVVSVHEGINNPCIAFPHEPLCGYCWVRIRRGRNFFSRKQKIHQHRLNFPSEICEGFQLPLFHRLSTNIMILEFQLPRVTNLPFVDQSYPSQAWEWIRHSKHLLHITEIAPYCSKRIDSDNFVS